MARRLRSPSNAELMSNDDPEVAERRQIEREATAREELQNLKLSIYWSEVFRRQLGMMRRWSPLSSCRLRAAAGFLWPAPSPLSSHSRSEEHGRAVFSKLLIVPNRIAATELQSSATELPRFGAAAAAHPSFRC